MGREVTMQFLALLLLGLVLFPNRGFQELFTVRGGKDLIFYVERLMDF